MTLSKERLEVGLEVLAIECPYCHMLFPKTTDGDIRLCPYCEGAMRSGVASEPEPFLGYYPDGEPVVLSKPNA